MVMVSTGTRYVQGHVSLVGKTSEDRRIMIFITFFFFLLCHNCKSQHKRKYRAAYLKFNMIVNEGWL